MFVFFVLAEISVVGNDLSELPTTKNMEWRLFVPVSVITLIISQPMFAYPAVELVGQDFLEIFKNITLGKGIGNKHNEFFCRNLIFSSEYKFSNFTYSSILDEVPMEDKHSNISEPISVYATLDDIPCAKVHKKKTRILNGKEATEHAFPWMV